MNQAGPHPFDRLDLSPEALKEMRDETIDIARYKSEYVYQKMFRERKTRESFINGVDVLWIEPQGVDSGDVVMYLFGGGFVMGSPECDLSIAAQIAHIMNKRVVMVDYRLSPENKFPCAYKDAYDVYTGLVDSGMSPVYVVGESAGGNLTVGLIQRLVESGERLPRAVGLLSPWIDLTHSGDSHKTNEGLDPTLSTEMFLKIAADAYAGDVPLNDPRVSPLFGEFNGDFPPTVVTTGTRDILLSDCVRLIDKLRDVDVETDLQIADGMWHVYEWDPLLPETGRSLRRLCKTLLKYK